MALNFRSTTEGIYDGEDNSQGIIFYPHKQFSISFASTITLPALQCEEHTFFIGTLTGNTTINAPAAPFAGDKMFLLFNVGSGGNAVITFGTNFKSAGTLTLTESKYGSAQFQFDGNNWIETGRTITV